jgi:hypothetical protein
MSDRIINALNLTLHRGAHEIGGSCVELRHREQSLIMDLGTPLMKAYGTPFDERLLKRKNPQTFITEGILPGRLPVLPGVVASCGGRNETLGSLSVRRALLENSQEKQWHGN